VAFIVTAIVVSLSLPFYPTKERESKKESKETNPRRCLITLRWIMYLVRVAWGEINRWMGGALAGWLVMDGWWPLAAWDSATKVEGAAWRWMAWSSGARTQPKPPVSAWWLSSLSEQQQQRRRLTHLAKGGVNS
jgi:hypothetical protein